MDQKSIGEFLKYLRHEKGLTQEEFAEILGVSNRSVSRYENGRNLPDFAILLQMAHFFDVSIDELLNGKRLDEETMTNEKATIEKIYDYQSQEKLSLAKRMRNLSLLNFIGLTIYLIIDFQQLTTIPFYAYLSDFMLGVAFGECLVSLLYTSRFMTKLKLLKRQWFENLTKSS